MNLMATMRLLRTRDAELWELRNDEGEKCYLALLDQRRPSQAGDFPYLNAAKFEGRDNLIQALVVTVTELEGSQKGELSEMVGSLVDHVAQAHCHWNVTFEVSPDPRDHALNWLQRQGTALPPASKFLTQE